MNKSCNEDKYKGEFGALDCLNDGVGQVAFVSKNSLDKYVKGNLLGIPVFNCF